MTRYVLHAELRNNSNQIVRNATVAAMAGCLSAGTLGDVLGTASTAGADALYADGTFELAFEADNLTAGLSLLISPPGQAPHTIEVDAATVRLLVAGGAQTLDPTGPFRLDDFMIEATEVADTLAPSVRANGGAVSYTGAVSVTPASGAFAVSLEQAIEEGPDDYLWAFIKDRSERLGFNSYRAFVDTILCDERDDRADCTDEKTAALRDRLRMCSVQSTDAFHLLRAATEAFLMHQCGRRDEVDIAIEGRGFLSSTAAQQLRAEYLTEVSANGGVAQVLPYYALIRERLSDLPIKSGLALGTTCYGILRSRIASPCFIELIWSYWHEQGMLAQTVGAVGLRFQNRRLPNGRDPLARLALDPLRPLGNLLWGYIQDEGRRLSIARRAYEYDYQYGLHLDGKAVPRLRSAESRSQFIGAFHALLNLAAAFFKEEDDLQTKADAFPLLNALRDLHLILAQGAHNQYGDLPWASRVEMLTQQYLLARPEMRDFLGGRPMVPYKEAWMDRVDAMKQMQGWSPVSITHFNDLAVFGEQLLLSVRFGNWSQIEDGDVARAWATTWRGEIQRYTYAYRAVTGVDLSGDHASVRLAAEHATQPAVLMRKQLARLRSGGDGAGADVQAPVPAHRGRRA